MRALDLTPVLFMKGEDRTSSQGDRALAIAGSLTLDAFKPSFGRQPILSKAGFDDRSAWRSPYHVAAIGVLH